VKNSHSTTGSNFPQILTLTATTALCIGVEHRHTQDITTEEVQMGWIQEFSKRGTIRARESGEASPQWVQGKALVVDLI